MLDNAAGGSNTFEFSGHGTVTLGAAGTGSAIIGVGNAGDSILLVNGSHQTIQGTGTIGAVDNVPNQPAFTVHNNGSIIASGGY